ncbi:hypothetical protein SADUNF_Sadunf04G0103000 [Salix dunnii]|uniref:Cyclin-dependent kinase inhibitor domain-containing protein n=1 Tax=Salix dunnii TaxID=1413687 RepID=A0A835K7U8_9ROSI|nr:hypothetical protein SADUNF_Sadunf04G0103000 [Salix dunnii]
MGENSKREAETEIPESSITSFSKKMKFDFDFEEFNLPSLFTEKMKETEFHTLSFKIKSAAKSSETESSTCIDRKFRKLTPSSEFHGNTDRMGSPEAIEKKENLHQRNSPAAGMPSLAEIDSFFAGAEKEEQKRFAEKYNYDVVMDLPMDGRYKWICLKR